MIGAGAVVTKDVAPGTLVVGVPAKVMKNLQTEVKLDIAPEEEKRIRMASPHIDYSTIEEVNKVLQSGQWVQGKKVKEFENKFAEYVGAKHAIAVANGTLALHLALIAAGVGPGDEVITTPFSFVASSNAILMCGATPVFVDIDPKTYNINPDLIEAEITTRTKAVLPVHLYGNPCDILKIKSICLDHNLNLVEDACQAHGAKVGLSTTCYSFYATKNLACGEGGMITTDDEKLANFVRNLRQHGGQKKYAPEYLGFNYRMTDISATIGLGNLAKLSEFTRRRRENAELLTGLLKDVRGIATPHSDFESVFHQYTIRVLPEFPLSRDELASKLKENGIDIGIFYPLPLSQMPHIVRAAGEASCPVAEKASKEVLSLPIHPGVSMVDIKRIAATLSEL
jgi:dTDP-4-amino-4,6-dideoxygalactose transaminase